jgi:hypothetical protein
MKARLVAIAALVCAMPASGQRAALPQRQIDALTPFDSVPSTSVLNNVFPMPLVDLRTIAQDPAQDLGITLRAIRALPSYCPPAPEVCNDTTEVHQTLVSMIGTFLTAFQTDPTPRNLLRLRAAIEALGATRSRLKADADLLTQLGTQLDLQFGEQFNRQGGRDLRTTVTRAIRSICNIQTLSPLSPQPQAQTRQPGALVAAALPDLGQCI